MANKKSDNYLIVIRLRVSHQGIQPTPANICVTAIWATAKKSGLRFGLKIGRKGIFHQTVNTVFSAAKVQKF